MGAPVLDTRVLKVEAGETFAITTWSTGQLKIGDRVPLDQVADKLPLSLKWKTVETA